MTSQEETPSAAPRPIFEARGLSRIYQMGDVQVEALRGVDLDLSEGELVVLLAPSGSGKSTLLNILGGLDAPTRGRVRYRDRDLAVFDDARAVAKRPQVLLCDEPAGALDAPTGVLVLDVIARVNRELGITTVVITRNSAIAAMADRVVHFGSRRVVSIEANAEKKSAAELSW